MMNDGKLKRGQIIKYDAALWRVDYVNDSRARIIPLAKRHVVLGDRVFDAERGGVNISPRSVVEVFDDIDRAIDEFQLAEAEAELAAAKRGVVIAAAVNAELVAAEAELAAARAEAGVVAPAAAAPRAARVGKTGGWHRSGKPTPEYRAGTLAALVMTFIAEHPGCQTKDIVAAGGNIGSCVSRFFQAGLIERG